MEARRYRELEDRVEFELATTKEEILKEIYKNRKEFCKGVCNIRGEILPSDMLQNGTAILVEAYKNVKIKLYVCGIKNNYIVSKIITVIRGKEEVIYFNQGTEQSITIFCE